MLIWQMKSAKDIQSARGVSMDLGNAMSSSFQLLDLKTAIP